jgi:hypothetical protein
MTLKLVRNRRRSFCRMMRRHKRDYVPISLWVEFEQVLHASGWFMFGTLKEYHRLVRAKDTPIKIWSYQYHDVHKHRRPQKLYTKEAVRCCLRPLGVKVT